MTTDPPEDPISAASAGLRGLGVAPQRRMETLGLLSALLDLADERGLVLLDAELMETEERLGIDACLEGYEWLERLGVITRTWSGWVIRNFDEHHGPAGMTAASLAVLQRHLSAAEPAPVPLSVVPAHPEPTPEMTPVVTLKPWRRRLPVVAASVAAGVAVLTGATQFVPQAAVSGRNAAVRTEGTATNPTAPQVAPTSTPEAASATTTHAPNAPTVPGTLATTTTTSTTVVPSLPCVSQTLNDLTSRTGLTKSQATVLPPGVLPCP